MIQSRRISAFTTIGIIITIISLSLCFMVIKNSYSSSGIAEERKIIYSYQIKNPSNVYISNDNMNITNKPSIKENIIHYGINLTDIGDYSQFTFEIENTGNIPLKVQKIKINYPLEYQNYVTISIEGLNENDIIQPGATFSNIKIITKYEQGLYNEYELINPILLNDISIKVELYE